jgi:ribosomal-protein-alanine N-acetyltransferase
MTRTRLVRLSDAPVITGLLERNRDFLAPTSPPRPEGFFTLDGQRAGIQSGRAEHRRGTKLPHVILTGDGEVAGRITLNEIVRGPFQSCHLGYWVGAEYNGRGLATGAVREIIRVAFEELGLHRIEAGTLLDNVPSQRVLERNGFIRFGMAPAYLHIAGRWQDHVLYQVLNEPAASPVSTG